MGGNVLKKLMVLPGAIIIILSYIPLLFLTKETIIKVTEEDGIYESLTALLFFFAAAVFLFIFFKVKKRNYFFLIFAMAFFFAGAEEISWGQRIFHFSTPAAMEAANAQKEFNIHNLTAIQHERGFGGTIKSLLNFNRLFILFWLVYTVVVPVANQYSSLFRRLFEKIRLPIPSLWFGALFTLNEVTSKTTELWLKSRLNFNPDVAEVKEGLWGLILCLIGIYFFSRIFSPQHEHAEEVARVPLH